MQSLSLRSTKSWLDRQSEEQDSDHAHMSVDIDSNFGIIKDKSASLFRKAGTFISSTQRFQATRDSEAALREDRNFGRMSGGARTG